MQIRLNPISCLDLYHSTLPSADFPVNIKPLSTTDTLNCWTWPLVILLDWFPFWVGRGVRSRRSECAAPRTLVSQHKTWHEACQYKSVFFHQKLFVLMLSVCRPTSYHRVLSATLWAVDKRSSAWLECSRARFGQWAAGRWSPNGIQNNFGGRYESDLAKVRLPSAHSSGAAGGFSGEFCRSVWITQDGGGVAGAWWPDSSVRYPAHSQ